MNTIKKVSEPYLGNLKNPGFLGHPGFVTNLVHVISLFLLIQTNLELLYVFFLVKIAIFVVVYLTSM